MIECFLLGWKKFGGIKFLILEGFLVSKMVWFKVLYVR